MKLFFANDRVGPYETGAQEECRVLAERKATRTHGEWLFVVLALLLFDLVFVKGYQFGIEDHHFYLPQLQAELDPSFYPNSTAILRTTNEFSLFNLLFAGLAHYLGVEWTFLLAYLVASASFYLVCFLLAEKLCSDRLAAYGFLLLMLPLTWTPGTATRVWENYLTHRGVVLPLCLFGVYQILNRKYVLAYFLFGLSALIHPITAATFATACSGAVVYDLWRKHISLYVALLAGGAMLAGAGPLIWKLLASPAGGSTFFAPTTPEWVAIVRERAPYMLPWSWSQGLWSRGAWFLLFLFAWLAKPLRGRQDAVVMGIVVGCGVLLGVSMLVGSIAPFLPLARFEFARSLLLVILFARLYLAAAFLNGLTNRAPRGKVNAILGSVAALSLYGEYLSPLRVGVAACAVAVLWGARFEWMSPQRRKAIIGGIVGVEGCLLAIEFLGALDLFPGLLPPRWISADSIALGLMTITVLTIVTVLQPLRSPGLLAAGSVVFCLAYVSSLSPEGLGVKSLYFPGSVPATPWVQAQLWAREHTAKDAVFLVPWKQAGFPVFSQRSIIGDWKSGGDAKFNPAFAQQWRTWRQDLGDFDRFTTKEFCRLRQKYQFNYIITKKEQLLQFPLMYTNQQFSIYHYAADVCQ